MASGPPRNASTALNELHRLNSGLLETYENNQNIAAVTSVLEDLGNLVLDNEQRALIGADSMFTDSITHLWEAGEVNVTSKGESLVNTPGLELVRYLARLTRNVAAGCPDNQMWISVKCEPSIRKLLHFFTSFYNSQNPEYHALTTLLTQCLANIVTGNPKTSSAIWIQYMSFSERENILTRLLAYPERKAVSATIIFILNSLSTDPEQSLIMARNIGGRATCAGLLDMADRIFEDEENVDHFHLIFKIFTKVFEDGALEPLHKSLQPSDGITSPHQIVLLKLLDAYTHDFPTPDACFSLNNFLPATLLSLLRTSNAWMSTTDDAESYTTPNENLPQTTTATVLVSQILANALMAEHLAWENSSSVTHTRRPILETLKDPDSSLVELIIDVLRQLDTLLPRIQFGKPKPQFTVSTPTSPPPTTAHASPDVSGFQFVKRDLVRLLGIIVHDDRVIQDRVRERGGVQVILGLCAIDERNPYIREHALFALRNLLHKNAENQEVVKEMEPIGKLDENGMLTET